MFNGIIQNLGLVVFFNNDENGCLIGIKILTEASNKAEAKTSKLNSIWLLKPGDSVACDGICLTVVKFQNDARHNNAVFFIQAAVETLNVTNIKHWKINETVVNLERPLKIGDCLDGHFVLGHIDCTVLLIQKHKMPNEEGTIMSFSFPNNLYKYISKKCSITLNGVALTVNEVNQDNFSVCVIPYTYRHTNLSKIVINETAVNLEVDMLARYIKSKE